MFDVELLPIRLLPFTSIGITIDALSLLGKNPVFFCKDIFGDVLKALSIKGMMVILNTSNFFGNEHFFVLLSCSFFVALRLTLHEFSPCLVPARPG